MSIIGRLLSKYNSPLSKLLSEPEMNDEEWRGQVLEILRDPNQKSIGFVNQTVVSRNDNRSQVYKPTIYAITEAIDVLPHNNLGLNNNEIEIDNEELFDFFLSCYESLVERGAALISYKVQTGIRKDYYLFSPLTILFMLCERKCAAKFRERINQLVLRFIELGAANKVITGGFYVCPASSLYRHGCSSVFEVSDWLDAILNHPGMTDDMKLNYFRGFLENIHSTGLSPDKAIKLNTEHDKAIKLFAEHGLEGILSARINNESRDIEIIFSVRDHFEGGGPGSRREINYEYLYKLAQEFPSLLITSQTIFLIKLRLNRPNIKHDPHVERLIAIEEIVEGRIMSLPERTQLRLREGCKLNQDDFVSIFGYFQDILFWIDYAIEYDKALLNEFETFYKTFKYEPSYERLESDAGNQINYLMTHLIKQVGFNLFNDSHEMRSNRVVKSIYHAIFLWFLSTGAVDKARLFLTTFKIDWLTPILYREHCVNLEIAEPANLINLFLRNVTTQTLNKIQDILPGKTDSQWWEECDQKGGKLFELLSARHPDAELSIDQSSLNQSYISWVEDKYNLTGLLNFWFHNEEFKQYTIFETPAEIKTPADLLSGLTLRALNGNKSAQEILCSMHKLTMMEIKDGGRSHSGAEDVCRVILSKCEYSTSKVLGIVEEKSFDDAGVERVSLESFTQEKFEFIRVQGRTVILHEKATGELVAIKIAKIKEPFSELENEFHSTRLLRGKYDNGSVQSKVPRPITVYESEKDSLNSFLERMLPSDDKKKLIPIIEYGRSVGVYIYRVERGAEGYFTYLHDIKISQERLLEACRHSMHDLALLFQSGMIFNQLADIFHNTEEGHMQRNDKGRYLVLASLLQGLKGSGRITAWLNAVLYVNLRESGIADLGDWVNFDVFVAERLMSSRFLSWLPRVEASNRVAANAIAEYFLVLELVLGSRYRKLTEEARHDMNSRDLFKKAALIMLSSVSHFIATLTGEPEVRIFNYLKSIISLDRYAHQMQFWMTTDYINYVNRSKLPEGLYESSSTVDINRDKFRYGTYNNRHGYSINDKDPDLGPVNGQEPIKEGNKLIYAAISLLFSIGNYKKAEAYALNSKEDSEFAGGYKMVSYFSSKSEQAKTIGDKDKMYAYRVLAKLRKNIGRSKYERELQEGVSSYQAKPSSRCSIS